MVIVSSKSSIILYGICTIIVFLLILCDGSPVGAMVFGGVLSIITIREWIIVGRTFVMDEEGCTIRFLWYKKKYQWEQMRIKQLENYR